MSAPGRILVYDGDCPLCVAIARRLARAAPESVRPWQAFAGPLARALAEAGMRNEMAVVDPESGEIRSGVRGLLWCAEGTRAERATRWLGRPPWIGILTVGYRLVAYNRRILAPPRRPRADCACDPDPHAGYRAAFVVLALGWAVGLAAGTGAWLATSAPGGACAGSVAVLAAFAVLWLACAARARPGPDCAGRSAWILAACAPILPAAALVARAVAVLL